MKLKNLTVADIIIVSSAGVMDRDDFFLKTRNEQLPAARGGRR